MVSLPDPSVDEPVNIDTVLRDLAAAEHRLPQDAMRWALENWEACAPRFIELLERYADGSDRSEAAQNALFFIIHLFGEKRETKSFRPLCRLLEDEAASEIVLGDAITESLSQILISVFDGDMMALKRLAESPTADPFSRASGLDALAYLTHTGGFGNDEMRAYMLHLRAEMQPRSQSFIWFEWALIAGNLGYRDFAGEVEDLLRLEFIPEYAMNMKDFYRDVQRALDDPADMEGFSMDRIEPFTDAIGTLAPWYEAREREDSGMDWEDETEMFASESPYTNPFRDVGRNDPCPCGSGKKYKKCCLK